MVLDAFEMAAAAKEKWHSLTSSQQDAVDQSFMAVLENPSRALIYRAGTVMRRFDQGLRTYDVIIIESEECFFAMGSYEDRTAFVLDLVVKGEVCVLVH